jgi:hypothetical protein
MPEQDHTRLSELPPQMCAALDEEPLRTLADRSPGELGDGIGAAGHCISVTRRRFDLDQRGEVCSDVDAHRDTERGNGSRVNRRTKNTPPASNANGMRNAIGYWNDRVNATGC